MEKRDGPFIAVGVICEKVLNEKDGVLSLIRMVDRVNVPIAVGATSPGTPQGLPALFLVIVVKSGGARGRHSIILEHEAPSGVKKELAALPVLFEGEDRGTNFVIQVEPPHQQEGLHWFAIRVDDQLMTKVPLRIMYLPILGDK